MKVCTNCFIKKDLNLFSKNKLTKDGYKSRCKDCVNKYTREYYKNYKFNETNLINKQCFTCKKIKSVENFYKRKNKIGINSNCKKCDSKYKKELIKNNPIKRKHQSKKDALKIYNLTIEKFLLLVKKQNNKCAICSNGETNKHKNGLIKNLSVDHCHKTGKIRGLLCGNCNRGLGMFKDEIYLLQKAKEYLGKNGND